MKPRSAFTLIEIIGVLIATGALLLLTVALLNQTLSTNRSALIHLQHIRTIEKFVARLRTDAQAATEVSVETNQLVLRSGQGECVYELKDRVMSRVRRAAGEDLGRDEWTLPSGGQVSWEVDDSGAASMLSGKIDFSDDPVAFGDVEFISRVGVVKDVSNK